MAGTNAAAAKSTLIAAINASSDSAFGTGATRVPAKYSFSGKVATANREHIYGANVEGSADHLAFKGSGNVPRREDLELSLVIEVTKPGEEFTETAEVRAVEIGAAVENLIAADPDLSGVTGLDVVKVVGLSLDSWADDDAAHAKLTYQIRLESSLG